MAAEARPVPLLVPPRVAGGSPPARSPDALLRSAARLAVLFVLAVGFFSMHGFVAVSAAADLHAAHATPAGGPEGGADPHGMAEGDRGSGAAATASRSTDPIVSSAAAGGAPEERDLPGPAEHHGVLAGCVVALVGVAVLLVTLHFVQGRHRRERAARLRPVGLARHALSGPALGLPPPRLRLCVIRV